MNHQDQDLCITESGIPGIGLIPRSFHFCNFYRNRQELIDCLVPFFAAGLKRNERCIWVTAEPLYAEDAKKELAKVVPNLEALIRADQIQFREAAKWYVGRDPKEITASWLAEEERALAAGYDGLRITGNTSFLSRETWDQFMVYEEKLCSSLKGRRITALCSYRESQCKATDVFEAARIHEAALELNLDGSWVLLPERYQRP